MAYTVFRAGSGAYQQIIGVNITPTAIPGFSTSVETYAPAALAQLTTDSVCTAQLATPIAGLSIDAVPFITATGTIQITWTNATGSTITPGTVQINVLVF